MHVQSAVGDYFELTEGNCTCRLGEVSACMRCKSAIPLLPAKQRPTHPNDWMSTDTRIPAPIRCAG